MKTDTVLFSEALLALQQEGTLLYPTDTIWGIGGDARSTTAVEKVYELKQREDSKALICLVANRKMLEEYVGAVHPNLLLYLEEECPTTVIYPKVKGISPRLCAANGSVGMRIAKDDFCQTLIEALGAPIISTSANISGQPSPTSFATVDEAIKQGVDHVVQIRQQERQNKASRIIRLNEDNTIEILRD